MITIDNFLPSDVFDELMRAVSVMVFGDVTSPYDGVTYPNINIDIPTSVTAAIYEKINEFFGRNPESYTSFVRESPAGVRVPHAFHHDKIMGDFSLMLYLNDNEDGGTAMVAHKETGISFVPESEEFLSIAIADQNNVDAWEIVERSKMRKNTAALFNAGQFHCALPIGGFGEGESSRKVLTVFFS